MLLNCGVGEDSWDCKEIQPVHPKGNQSRIFMERTDAEAETPVYLTTWCEELTPWKRPWCWERLKAGREGDDRKWEMVGWHHRLKGCWVWASSRSRWRTAKPGVVHSMESQRVRHDWATELNWLNTEVPEFCLQPCSNELSSQQSMKRCPKSFISPFSFLHSLAKAFCSSILNKFLSSRRYIQINWEKLLSYHPQDIVNCSFSLKDSFMLERIIKFNVKLCLTYNYNTVMGCKYSNTYQLI